MPADAVLGEIGKGHKVAFNVLNFGRFKLGAMTLGGARATLGEAAKYAATRKQFGVPIATFGAIRHKLGEMTARAYAPREPDVPHRRRRSTRGSRPPASSAASTLQALEEFAVEASIAKVYGSEAVDFVIDESAADLRRQRLRRRLPDRAPLPRRPRQPHLRGHQRDQPPADPRHADQEGGEGRAAADGRGQGAAGRAARPAGDARRATARWPPSGGPSSASRRSCCWWPATAMQRHGEQLQDEQEVLSHLADIVIDAYAAESAVLRALAATARPGDAGPARGGGHRRRARSGRTHRAGRAQRPGGAGRRRRRCACSWRRCGGC